MSRIVLGQMIGGQIGQLEGGGAGRTSLPEASSNIYVTPRRHRIPIPTGSGGRVVLPDYAGPSSASADEGQFDRGEPTRWEVPPFPRMPVVGEADDAGGTEPTEEEAAAFRAASDDLFWDPETGAVYYQGSDPEVASGALKFLEKLGKQKGKKKDGKEGGGLFSQLQRWNKQELAPAVRLQVRKGHKVNVRNIGTDAAPRWLIEPAVAAQPQPVPQPTPVPAPAPRPLPGPAPRKAVAAAAPKPAPPSRVLVKGPVKAKGAAKPTAPAGTAAVKPPVKVAGGDGGVNVGFLPLLVKGGVAAAKPIQRTIETDKRIKAAPFQSSIPAGKSIEVGGPFRTFEGVGTGFGLKGGNFAMGGGDFAAKSGGDFVGGMEDAHVEGGLDDGQNGVVIDSDGRKFYL